MTRRTKVAILATGCLALAGTGYLLRSYSVATPSPGPRIACARVIDLGPRELGETVTTKLQIENRGLSELAIADIRTSCSCTGMEYEQDGELRRVQTLRVKPLDKICVTIRLSVRGITVGSSASTFVTFSTNDPDHQECSVELRLPSVSGGVFSNPSNVSFGSIQVGSTAEYRVTVYDDAVSPRKILSVTSSNPTFVGAEAVAPAELPMDAGVRGKAIASLRIRINTEKPKEINEFISIALDDISIKSDDIAVTGRVSSPIEITPGSLVLPRLSSQGKVYEAQCVCRSTNGVTWSIRVRECPRQFRVDVESPPGTTAPVHRLKVRYSPSGSVPQEIRNKSEAHVIKIVASTNDGDIDFELPIIINER